MISQQVATPRNFDHDVLEPLKKQQAAAKAEAERIAAEEAARAALEAQVVYEPPAPVYVAPAPSYTPSGALTGSIGYALVGGNCVNQIPYGLRAPGNPISWPVTTSTPYIGGAALFGYNHVGRVVGIWSNGDLEIAHENYGGGQHRFPRSVFRGFR